MIFNNVALLTSKGWLVGCFWFNNSLRQYFKLYRAKLGWSSVAMALGNCQGVLQTCIIVGTGPTALAVDAGGSCLDILYLAYQFLFRLS